MLLVMSITQTCFRSYVQRRKTKTAHLRESVEQMRHHGQVEDTSVDIDCPLGNICFGSCPHAKEKVPVEFKKQKMEKVD